MKKIFSLMIAGLLVTAMPLAALAQSHNHGGHDTHGGGHSSHGQAGKEMLHGDHAHQEMVNLGAQNVDGVRAVAHLNDVGAAMAKAGMKETHHFMIFFVEGGSGNPIESGSVALKIKGPDGKEVGPIALMGMDGHFGADIVLAAKGHHEFTVGSKLADGKTRQFNFMHMLK